MRHLLQLLAVASILLAISGCEDDNSIFRANPSAEVDPESKAIAAEIADLALEAKAKDNADASVASEAALHNLMQRGAKVETRIIDALRSSPDPYIRLGCVQVLNTVASTPASIPHLIAVLDDSFPLVAWHADIGLRQLCQVRMIPEAGQPASKDGLPPLRERRADEVDSGADERIWAEWHAVNKAALKAAWERWWGDHKDGFKLPK